MLDENMHAASPLIPDHHILKTCSCDSYKRQNMKAARKHHLYMKRAAVGLPLKSLRSVFELMECTVIFLSSIYENALCLPAKRL